jgi:UDP-3-O-[3-hydroxymyristoyl] glucosamine N-acyltransferase
MASVTEIARLVGGEDSESARRIARVSAIGQADAESIVFATDAAALVEALASSAGAILTTAKAAARCGASDARLILVAEPRYAFALAARLLASPTEVAGVHATAVLGAGATIGARSAVGPHCVIGAGVTMGDDCTILSNVTIYPGTTLGNRVLVQAGAALGATGFGYARGPAGQYVAFPQIGTLVVGDDVDIGANTTIDRGALGETRIGRGTKIDNLVHIAHNCVIGEDVVIAAQTGISGSSVVENGAILGGQVGIGEHARVGTGVILGGGAGVLSNKKMSGPGEVFWGRPARPLKQYLRDLARLSRGGR